MLPGWQERWRVWDAVHPEARGWRARNQQRAKDTDENQVEWWQRYIAKYPNGGPNNPPYIQPDPSIELSDAETKAREASQLLEAHWEGKIRLTPAEQSKRYRERNREATESPGKARESVT
jgi:hypothetical protein